MRRHRTPIYHARVLPIDDGLFRRLHSQANAERWHVPLAPFSAALAASAGRAFASSTANEDEVERYLTSLHLEDLALACGCAAGDEDAWEHFVREFRPPLYRTADAMDPTGGARELEDSLYGDLFGVANRETDRQSLFRYFHGRSSLATWLRAVLSQRFVDRVRAARRHEELPDQESPQAIAAPERHDDPERDRDLHLLQDALAHAVEGLDTRDRLRLRCYYAQGLTLAETGRLTRESEATVSRHLARTRRTIRDEVERRLRAIGLTDAQIAGCVATATADAGPMDVQTILGVESPRKESPVVRSQEEKAP
jgi:RNA polymerase sigma-70 factor